MNKKVLFVLFFMATTGLTYAKSNQIGARGGHSAVYDPVGKQMLIFGGSGKQERDFLSRLLPDLWIYDVEKMNWEEIKGGPSPRTRHSAIYDSANKQMIVFGGKSKVARPNRGLLSDIWIYDIEKKTWKEIKAEGETPLPRAAHSAVYDPVSKQMFVFGGNGDEGQFSDLWAYDIEKNSWKEIDAKEKPSSRAGHSAIYDPIGKQILIFGGISGDNKKNKELSDLWSFNIEENSWKNIAGEAPTARSYHSAVYDPKNKQMFVFGGQFSDSWTYDIEKNKWEEVKTEELLLPRVRHSAIYNEVHNQMLIFGGEGVKKRQGVMFPDLWAFDMEKKNWQKLDKVPLPRSEHSAVYDSKNKQMIVFAGAGSIMVSEYFFDLWAYNIEKNRWTEIAYGTEEAKEAPPVSRSQHTAVYNSTDNQILVFGGSASKSFFSDLFMYDIDKKSWKELAQEEAPASRQGHSAVYDPIGKQMLVFGGKNERECFSDLWVYDTKKIKWERIQQEGPRPRIGHSAVYDSRNKQMIIFGGSAPGKSFSDLWIYNIEKKTWKEMKLKKAPPARFKHSAIYDAFNNQMLIFGGMEKKGERLSDLWAYDIEKNSWEKIFSKKGPLPRIGHSAVYDPINKQMIVFGGNIDKNGNHAKLSDLWIYDIEKKVWAEKIIEDGF